MSQGREIGNTAAEVRLDGYQESLHTKRTKGYYSTDNPDGYTEMRHKAGGIKSRKVDQELLHEVAKSVNDDGKVDLNEAKNILLDIAAGRAAKSKFTCNERWTLRYCIGEFEWDQDAHDFIITESKKIENILDIDDMRATNPAEIKKIFEGPTDAELQLDVAAFAVGQEVEFEGLVKMPELNGKTGKITAFVKDTGRYKVAIPGCDELRRTLEKNLKIAGVGDGQPPAKKPRVTEEDGLVFVDGMMLDKDIIVACRRALSNGPTRTDGSKVIDSLEALDVFKAAADDGVVTRTERWTLRFCFASYPFTRAAHNFLVEALGRDKFSHPDEKGK